MNYHLILVDGRQIRPTRNVLVQNENNKTTKITPTKKTRITVTRLNTDIN